MREIALAQAGKVQDEDPPVRADRGLFRRPRHPREPERVEREGAEEAAQGFDDRNRRLEIPSQLLRGAWGNRFSMTSPSGPSCCSLTNWPVVK